MLIRAASVATVFLARRLSSLCIYDELSLGQKLVCHLHCRGKVSAEIATQVDYEILHALLRQFCQCDEQFGISVLTEVLHLDISRLVVNHIC